MTPKELIPKMLKNIEQTYNIKILFAIESGSRVWRLESENSDYDVRFVFVRRTEDYLGLDYPEDVLQVSFDKMGIRMGQEGCYYDMCGFDIYKFVRMLAKSNPTTVEWLQSDITYMGEQPKELQEWIKNYFNPISLFFHYRSMSKQNYEKYLKSKTLVTYKKYLYAMRGLVNAKYVEQFNQIPPIDFTRTLQTTFLPDHIRYKLLEIIDLKKSGKEKDIIENIIKFDEYIELFLRDNYLENHKPFGPTWSHTNYYILDKYLRGLHDE